MASHLAAVDRALMETVERGGRLMVFCPPRHGKSELISKWLPAWYLGCHPDRRVILCSHTQELAADFSAEARDLLIEYGMQYFGVSVSPHARAKHKWLTTKGGGLLSAGAGGSITGRGANLLIIDDPVKNAEEALSATYRQKSKDWWESTASSRLAPGAAVVLMNTRWHDDDLSGWLLKQEPDRWRVLSLPAIASVDDPIGRQEGEALWPQRWPLNIMEQIRKDKTPYWWEAMYQQRPGQYGEAAWPAEWFDEIWCPADKWPREFEASAIALDPALGRDKKRGDYSAIVFAGLHNKQVYVDCHLCRDAPPVLVEKALTWCAMRQPDVFACEQNGFQELVGAMLTRRAAEMGLLTFNCRAIQNTGDKISRIEETLTGLLSRGKLKLREGSPHTRLLFDQLRAIPNGDHDDGPDGTEMAVRVLAEYVQGPAERVTGRTGG